MLGAAVLVISLGAGAYLAFSPRLRASSDWTATVTPLASIMGSGFLVSAPLLGGIVGTRAVFFMAALLVLAYGVGAVIRFNIRHFEPVEQQAGRPQRVALVSRWVLAGAYFVTVSYYLQLLSAFVLRNFEAHSPTRAHLLTSALLLLICGIGLWRGLGMLERVERFAVALNLGMIAALLAALAYHNARLALSGSWSLPQLPSDIRGRDVRVLLGLLIVVQGFETSRYMGDTHPPEQRIAAMRRAQLIAGATYVVFVGLATVLFEPGLGADVTAILDMTAPVASILPLLLSVAAVGSQWSAAVADTEGAGGLLEDITEKKLSVKHGYALILLITTGLTWLTHVNSIIAYASRAFALFYALQCAVAIALLWEQPKLPARRMRLVLYPLLGLLCVAVAVLGLPAE